MNPERVVTFGRRGSQKTPRVPARDHRKQPLADPPRLSYADLSRAGEEEAEIGRDQAPLTELPSPRRGSAAYGANETQMRWFIGPGWEDYRDLWLQMKHDGALRPGFSFDAFFFSSLWLFYRRLYAPALAATGFECAVMGLSPSNFSVWQFLLSLGVGFFGKSLVIRRGMKTIGALAESGRSSGQTALRIEQAGGTRLLAPVASTALLASVTFALDVGRQIDGSTPPTASWRMIATSLDVGTKKTAP
ncbi:DUF2628 domain-containing protein [Methylocystis echinoides]|uniref:DUF2628 domain-containing protein n=1 Tax=Methylocystis echinoides TaxID=29468 RepID=UPI0034371D0A